MKVSRAILVLASFALAATQAFGARTLNFATTVSYSSGVQGANAVVSADVNGDGFPDMIVATNNGVSVLLNNGDGTFAAPTTYATGGTLSNALALADVNNDGFLDIVVTNECLSGTSCYGVAVLLGNGDGTFQAAVGYNSGGLETGGLAVGDVNGDGWPDLVLVSNCQPQTCAGGTSTLLLNNGDGTFGSPNQLSDARGPVAIGDVNGDGIPDLVTAAGVMLGLGGGAFGPANGSVVSGAISIVLADINGDGKLDVVATVPTGVVVQLGNGDGTFQSGPIIKTGGVNPLGVAVADLNGDGKLDLAVANECYAETNGQCSASGRIGVLAGKGDGTFLPAVVFVSGGAYGTGVAAADVNQDGKSDLVVSSACVSTTNCGNGVLGALINNYMTTVSLKVVSSLNPAILNQPVTFTVTVSSVLAVADGTPITFTDVTTGVTLGTPNTVGGVASVTASFSAKGGHTVRASFAGDLYHDPGSAQVGEVINRYPSTVTLGSSPSTSSLGQQVTFTANVTSGEAGGPTGTVQFKNGTTFLGSAKLSGGVATLNTTKLPAGTWTITADYLGDTQSAPASGTTMQIVQ